MSNFGFWDIIRTLVKQHNAIDLSWGCPDFLPTPEVRGALVEVAFSNDPTLHQYTQRFGHPRLVAALAGLYSPLLNHNIQPETEVVVTLGAIQALYQTCTGILQPGDEVILLEPFFQAFEKGVKRAGATPVYVPMSPPQKVSEGCTQSEDWKLDMDKLDKAFTSKTKAIFINNPHNPLGKVFTEHELENIAVLCKKHDVLVIADEVYEWLVYDEHKFVKIAALPGMWERTVTIGSCGKSYSVTGWKVGWTIGPPRLCKLIASQYTSMVSTPMQETVAKLIEMDIARQHDPSFSFTIQRDLFCGKRDRFLQALKSSRLIPCKPMGGYFIVVDTSLLDFPFDESGGDSKSEQFVTWLAKNKGVSATPMSLFYSQKNQHQADNFTRFCFIKSETTLQKVDEVFKKWTPGT